MLLGKGEARTCRRKGSHMPCSAAQPQEPPVLYWGHHPFETLSPTTCHGAASSLAMPSGWVRAEEPLLPCPSHPHPHALRGWLGAKASGERSRHPHWRASLLRDL